MLESLPLPQLRAHNSQIECRTYRSFCTGLKEYPKIDDHKIYQNITFSIIFHFLSRFHRLNTFHWSCSFDKRRSPLPSPGHGAGGAMPTDVSDSCHPMPFDISIYLYMYTFPHTCMLRSKPLLYDCSFELTCLNVMHNS